MSTGRIYKDRLKSRKVSIDKYIQSDDRSQDEITAFYTGFNAGFKVAHKYFRKRNEEAEK